MRSRPATGRPQLRGEEEYLRARTTGPSSVPTEDHRLAELSSGSLEARLAVVHGPTSEHRGFRLALSREATYKNHRGLLGQTAHSEDEELVAT